MPKFALKRVEIIKGKQTFDKLLIDGKCQFDDFEDNLQKNKRDKKNLGSIYRYMQMVADCQSPPDNKFKVLKDQKGPIKEYEFKKNNLRVYVIDNENGKIIILGGFKNTQRRDIRKFQSIKEQYLKSLEHGYK